MLSLSHKKEFLKICLKSTSFGLVMAVYEGKNYMANNFQKKRENNLVKVCCQILVELISKQKSFIMKRDTLSELREEIQLIEDIKYLISKANQIGNADIAPYNMQIPFQFVSFKHASNEKLVLISQSQLSKLGVKKNFLQIVSKSYEMMIVKIKEKYFQKVFCQNQDQTGDIQFVNNVLIDQLNQIKYSLLGYNFYQKQIEDVPVKSFPLLSTQILEQKFETVLFNEPKLLQAFKTLQCSESLKLFINSLLMQQLDQNLKILSKTCWKSELILDCIMRQSIELKLLAEEKQKSLKKMMTIWRNKYVSKTISFLGFKYSGCHFLHQIALKPFYVSSSKTTIFYLSQFFQSLRWDTNFQIHKLLMKKSQQMPSVAHNVIWFCRVEKFIDLQPHRKVPLPIAENLNQKASQLENLIFSQMNSYQVEYFNVETQFLEKITSISGELKPSQSKDEKKAIIRDRLIQYNQEIPSNIYLPTNQRCRVVGIVTSSGMPMQSAARVPILVSFEVQDYEGPDQDVSINKFAAQKDLIKEGDELYVSPVKQSSKLKKIFSKLSQVLLKFNQISVNKEIGDQVIQEELKEQIFSQQLQNFQNINENLIKILNEKFKQLQNWEQNEELQNQQKFQFEKKIRSTSLINKQGSSHHLPKINHQPDLKIKMGQYSFQTKQNPMAVENNNFLQVQKFEENVDTSISPSKKAISNSVFAQQNLFLSNQNLGKTTKKEIQGNKGQISVIKDQNESFASQGLKDKKQQYLEESPLATLQDVSDSESIYDYGIRKSSPNIKSSIQKKVKKRNSPLKNQTNEGYSHFSTGGTPSLTNQRNQNLNQISMMSSYHFENPCQSIRKHHSLYKPSIFGGRNKFAHKNYGNIDRLNLIRSNNPNSLVSNGINLVLEFEQQLLQSIQKETNLHQVQRQTKQNSLHFEKDLADQQIIPKVSLFSSKQTSSQQQILDNCNIKSQNQQTQGGKIHIIQKKDISGPVKIVSCIFKVNDDLRQDILALQFIKLFQKIFKKCELNLFVAPYKCISNRTGDDQLLGGIIEVVPNSNSRDQIGKAFEMDLYDYFLKKYGNEQSKQFMNARSNFINSLAAYSVVSYILQIKDRHNGNILVDDHGNLVHIDFGFVFDWSPGKDMRFESANFKFTKEFIKILGGNDKAEPYKLFVQKTIQGYLAIREHYREFMSLVELMIYSGFPCFKPTSLQTLQQRLKMEGDYACSNQFEAAAQIRSVIQDAHDKWSTNLYDVIQYRQNKIVY